jgi:hypothetical protein
LAKPTRNYGRDHGRLAANLFAATVVMTIGAGTCLMIVYVSAPDASVPILLIVGGLVGLIGVIWLLSSRSPRRNSDGSLTVAEQQARMDAYLASFRPRRHCRRGHDGGSIAPPSADALRQIKEDSNAWRPSDRRVEEYRKKLKDSGE